MAVLADRTANLTIQVKDWQGKLHPFVVGPQNPRWTPSARIPAEMKWAVIVAEDANFYRHEGIDVTALKNAIKHDLEKKRFATVAGQGDSAELELRMVRDDIYFRLLGEESRVYHCGPLGARL